MTLLKVQNKSDNKLGFSIIKVKNCTAGTAEKNILKIEVNP